MKIRNLTLCCLVLAASGCDDPTEGDRARINRCPTDESCSARHADGLRFVPDVGPKDGIVALGGTRTLRLTSPDEEEEPLGEWTVAEGDGIISTEKLDDDRVRVTALAEGRETVRILDPSTGELLDRKEITVESVGGFRYGRAGAATSGKLRVSAGEQVLAIELLSKDGRQLVDDSLSADWNGEPLEASWWSTGAGFPFVGEGRFGTTVSIQSPTSDATLTITAAGQSVSLEVLPGMGGDAKAEQIEPVVHSTSIFQNLGRGTLPAGVVGVQCFSALIAGAPTTGLEFAFESSANISFEQVGPCLRVTTPSGGAGDEAWIQVRSGALTRVFPLDIE